MSVSGPVVAAAADCVDAATGAADGAEAAAAGDADRAAPINTVEAMTADDVVMTFRSARKRLLRSVKRGPQCG